jgi:hypothetical protein
MNINKRHHDKTPRDLYDKNLIKTIALEWEARWKLASSQLPNNHDHIIW